MIDSVRIQSSMVDGSVDDIDEQVYNICYQSTSLHNDDSVKQRVKLVNNDFEHLGISQLFYP